MAKNFKVASKTKLPIKKRYLNPFSLKPQLLNFSANNAIGAFNK